MPNISVGNMVNASVFTDGSHFYLSLFLCTFAPLKLQFSRNLFFNLKSYHYANDKEK